MYIHSIKAPTGIVTLMFTDIVNSTAMRDGLVAEHGEVEGNRFYRERYLDPHNARIRGFLAKHNGFEVKMIGDAFFAAFAQPSDAVLCAVAIQRSLRDDPIGIAIRIGMHTGAVAYKDDDYDGHAVNIAARVESLLKGGDRIYCSSETAALAKNLPGIRYHRHGTFALKGVSGPIEIIEVLWDGAPQPLPPEQSHERLRYPWLTNWVGREKEMDDLAAALRSSRLVTLHGIGGVGKTRLAVEMLLAKGGGLPREVVFVSLELARNEPAGLLTAVRDALGLTEVDAPDFDRLCRYLQGGDRLLLLDNFESVRHAAKEVPRVAMTPGVRVLVTSQHALNVLGERVVELDRMTPDESRRLFVTIAQQRAPSWQPNDEAAMSDVLAATDGLPYLIEIIAAAAQNRPLRQLADELNKRLTKVRSKDPSRLDRHASVQACLAWALDRLPEKKRQALPRLAIFAGGFDAEAALAIASTTIESLDALVDASLVRFDRDTGRYSLLSTTRRFAKERIEDRDALAASHAKWFIERLDRADDALRAAGGAAQAIARQWITTELENVQEAGGWAETSDPPLFERAVTAFGVYMSQTNRFSEMVRLNNELLRCISFDASPQSWAMTQSNLGTAYRNLPTGDLGENLANAIACFHAALRVRTERDLPTEWATTQNNLGNAYANLLTGDRGDNLTNAIACYQAALRVRTERDFPTDWAMTQNNLGNAYSDLPTGDRGDNLTNAIAFFRAALRVYTERDFPVDWAMTQNNLGVAYRNLPTGDPGENFANAIACYQAALRVYTESDFPIDWAMTQNNLGAAYWSLPTGDRRENVANAIACFQAGLRVCTERDLPAQHAETQSNLGLVYAQLAADDLRRREEAIACFEAAARGYSAVGLLEKAEKARQRAAALRRTA